MIEPILNKYFKYDKIFNLVEYDHDLSLLYNELLMLKKNAYDADYRFIFLHWDTDYYITNDQPGLLLRNLQRILFSLDISNYFSLIVTHQNIDTQLEQLRIEETTDDIPIACIVTMLQEFNYDSIDGNLKLNPDLIEKKYISLNGQRRFHRTFLYSYLKHMNLLDQGIVSYAATTQYR